ncbi:HEAT repeat domain-containing protein [Moorena sp. SIOASIH]|uniref:NACHT domain-containing protein n=1 Tax=Moorena sp. SIOASIH TaxID=2607817 RepID=UPI0025D53F78|nr:HEAT repeat domain-containing protein [Moorena sp. SIOASIH]
MVTWDPYLASIRNTYAQWWQVYTLSDVEDRKRKQQQQTPRLFDFNLMVQTIKLEQPQRDENREEIERLPVLEGLRKYATDHVLLVGRPGSGKSTALVQLLRDEGIQGKIPVLLELRYYQTSVLELLRNFLKRHGVLLDSTEIERLLFEGQFLLLIDGVNELPSEAARINLTQFRQDYQKTTPMIFTTRDLGVGGDLGIQKKLEMQPLSADQMSEFVRKYLPQQGEQMLEQLGDRLREFGQTPLLLMMLCALFQDQGEIPSNLGLVFRSFTQFYSDNIKQDVNVSRASKLLWPDLLQQLAFVMTIGDNPEEISVAISKTKAEEILTDYLRQKALVSPNVCAKTWLDDLLKHHLIQQSGDLIEFRHQLLQEYYTAEYLLKQLPRLSDQELQQNYLNYLKWTEPLVMMLQLVDDESQAQRVVRLGLDVDWQLGARLAGAVKTEFKEDTVGWVARLNVPKSLKVQLLGITQSEKAIPELIKSLDNKNLYVRISAASALGEIGTEATIDPLIKFLDDPDPSVRISAADALGKIGTEARIEPLIKCLHDQDYSVRRMAVSALGEIGTEVAINRLIKSLDDPDYSVRRMAPEALEEIGTEATIDPLIKLLDDDHSDVRGRAAEALGKIGTEATIDPLIKLLDDDHSDVRGRAAEALGKIGTEATIDPLIKLLDDDAYFVRSRAAEALGEIGTEATIDPLIKLLDDDAYFVRSRAAEALGEIGTEATIDPLIKLLDDEDYFVRISAADALGKIGAEVAIDPLIKSLNNPDSSVRISAADALGKIGAEVAIDPLIKSLDDDDYYVRESAADALEKIGHRSHD